MPRRMLEEGKVQPDAWLAVVPLAGRVCSFEGCGAAIAAARTFLTPLAGGLYAYEAAWACADHAGLLDDPQPLAPTCRASRPDASSPCGAATSHVALAGVPVKGLRAVSVCARHAGEVEKLIPAL